MCDSFAGYSSHINGEDLRRQRFSEQFNMELPEEQDITDSSCSSMGSLREKCAGTRLSTTRWRFFFVSSRSLNIVAWETVGYTTTEKSFEMNGRDPVELQCEIEQCDEDLANKLVSGARCFTVPS